MTPASVWLLGAEAQALGPRLQASGYALWQPQSSGSAGPDVVVLTASQAERIPALRQRFGATPLLLNIGEDTVEARAHCLSAGADDFWLSSLGPSDLLMRLRLQLSLRQSLVVPTQLLQVADLTLNPSTRDVRRGRRHVALTAREYALLVLLLERRGTVVSREQILRQVWDDNQATSSNVIEVYVRYLRQKLEEGGARRLIHTVRGQGYCLSERQPPAGGV
ncbi:winged helix family transcriptional regulator [Cyanobium sp. LEGE 06113]|uniref:winged helix family transcriptional regulator n=1 Tax=Cyanobium sp. LEGE 06113 TaxID=1297573 RepID=UPI00187FBBC0|nr:response regulator transcription factor [Cyanobium sp. LEGE 06113]MBE9155020.1 response regulator transcription factor [Cyanobium sp. LEGE 06113]